VLLVAACQPGSSPDLQDTGRSDLTVLTLNLHTYQEFRSEGAAESELTDELVRERIDSYGSLFDRIAAAINELDPDIVCFQEVGEWSHYGFDVWLEGSAILSKHSLVETGSRYISYPDNGRHKNWKSRNVPMARIDLPETGRANVFSVHTGWWDDDEEPFQEQYRRLLSWAGKAASVVNASITY
jgi:maltose 6'-phosphate phosphatase